MKERETDVLFDDDMELPLDCDECGHVAREKWSHLKNNPILTCPGCGATHQVNAEQLRETERATKKALKDAFGGLGGDFG